MGNGQVDVRKVLLSSAPLWRGRRNACSDVDGSANALAADRSRWLKVSLLATSVIEAYDIGLAVNIS
jgi:hypothetical protein